MFYLNSGMVSLLDWQCVCVFFGEFIACFLCSYSLNSCKFWQIEIKISTNLCWHEMACIYSDGLTLQIL